MHISFWAVALFCFLNGLHSHPLSELIDLVANRDKIVNGIPASPGDFPYMSVLYLNGYLCGGTLIGPSHILTAAHCLYEHTITEVGLFNVVLNSLNIDGSDTGAVIRGVKNFIVHENYNPSTMENDVALLVLDSPVTNLPFVNLPTDSSTNVTTVKPTTTKLTTTIKTTAKPTTTTKTTTTKTTTTTTTKPTTTKTTTPKPTTTTKTTTTTTTKPPTTKTTTPKPTTTTKTTTTTTTKPPTTKTTTPKPTTTIKTTTTTTTKPPTTKTTTPKPTTTTKTTTTTTTKPPTTKTTTPKPTTTTKTSTTTTPKPTTTTTPKPTTSTSPKPTTTLTMQSTTNQPSMSTVTSCTCTCPPTTAPSNETTTINPLCSVFADSMSDIVPLSDLFNSKTVKAFSTYSNSPAVIAGWGTTSSGGSISNVLLKADVVVQDNTVCTQQYGSSFFGADMLCASAPGTDTCQGDSGGPIFVNGVQVGITSWGSGCADPNFAGIYTRVTTYLGWIATTQANNP